MNLEALDSILAPTVHQFNSFGIMCLANLIFNLFQLCREIPASLAAKCSAMFPSCLLLGVGGGGGGGQRSRGLSELVVDET